MRNALRNAFESKDWSGRGNGPRSGPGSTMAATEALRAELPRLFKQYNVKAFLDAPCGDWTWMQHVDLSGVRYIGGDISAQVVEAVKDQHASADREFVHLDITSDPLPKVDMMMCRDCLFHLKWWLRWAFFENFVASETPFLLTTMHHVPANLRLKNNAGFQRFNPCVAPFNFGEPLESISETGDINLDPDFLKTAQGRDQRSVGLWSREQVIDALERHKNET